MNVQDTVFPQYRKYVNGKNFFKIINPLNFEEVRIIGSMKKFSRVFAGQYSEKQFLNDLLNKSRGMIVEITAEEFELLKKECGVKD